MPGLLDVLHHVHGVVLEERRIGDERDVKPATVLNDEFSQRLEIEVGFFDLRVVHSVARSVFNPGEVAVELFGSNAFSNLVKQFTVIFRSSHLPVAPCMDVGDVEDGDGAFDVVDHFKHLFEAAPQFLATRCFNTNFGRRSVFNPREHGEFILIVMPDFMNTVDDARIDVGDLLVRSMASSKLAVMTSVECDVAGIDGAGCLKGCFDFC